LVIYKEQLVNLQPTTLPVNIPTVSVYDNKLIYSAVRCLWSLKEYEQDRQVIYNIPLWCVFLYLQKFNTNLTNNFF